MKAIRGWLVAVWAGSVLSTQPALAEEDPTPPAQPAPSVQSDPSATTTPSPEPAPAPATQVTGGVPGTLKIHFRTNQPGVVFHYAALARPNPEFVPVEWSRACLAECDVYLEPGPYRFALSHGTDAPVMAPKLVDLRAPERFEGTYGDNTKQRQTGILVAGLGTVISGGNIVLGSAFLSMGERELGSATLIAGSIGVLLSLAIGLPLAFANDESLVVPEK